MRSLENGLYLGDFTTGSVVMNLSGAASPYTAEYRAVLMNGGIAGQELAAGQAVDVPAVDALFLFRM